MNTMTEYLSQNPSQYPRAFERAWAYTMHHEVGGLPNGGLNTTSGDPGGTTKYGISQRAHPGVDIAGLTEDGAKSIGWDSYWVPLRLQEVVNEEIAIEIYDTGFNAGRGTAVRLAQRAINLLHRREGWSQIVEDGRIGPVTIRWLNLWGHKDPDALLGLLNGLQCARYLEIIENNPRLIYALRSWARRLLPPVAA